MLNQEFGEITSFGANFSVVPIAKWAETNIFNRIYDLAISRMDKKIRGVTRFDPTEMSVQEYHRPEGPHLVFFFHKHRLGVDYYDTIPVTLSPMDLSALVTIGMWPAYSGPMKLVH